MGGWGRGFRRTWTPSKSTTGLNHSIMEASAKSNWKQTNLSFNLQLIQTFSSFFFTKTYLGQTKKFEFRYFAYCHQVDIIKSYFMSFDAWIISEIDNDAYCVCTRDFSLCTHRNFGPVHTMYAVKISGTQTVFSFMRTQKKNLSQNDNFSTSFVWLLCQQWKSSYNINVAFARSLLTYHAI